jgi:hypothetical protein
VFSYNQYITHFFTVRKRREVVVSDGLLEVNAESEAGTPG